MGIHRPSKQHKVLPLCQKMLYQFYKVQLRNSNVNDIPYNSKAYGGPQKYVVNLDVLRQVSLSLKDILDNIILYYFCQIITL